MKPGVLMIMPGDVSTSGYYSIALISCSYQGAS